MNASEDAFRQWATDAGWTVTKHGWPDFLCWRDGEFVAVEVKIGPAQLTDEQKFALATLHALGVPTFIWTRSSGLLPYPKPQRYTRETAADVLVEVGALRLRVDDLEAENRSLRDRLTVAESRYLNDGRTRQISRMTTDIRRLIEHAHRGRTPAALRAVIARYEADESC